MPIPTRPFAFDESAGLEEWEVHEILDKDAQSPQKFKNWVGNVAFEPSVVLLVRSVEGARRVVRWAKRCGKKLRVAGYRHTWSDLWNGSGDVIMTFVHPDARETLPYYDPPSSWRTEFSSVSLVPNVANRTPEPGHAFARVLAGTSNNTFREWSAGSGFGLPFNIVVTEVTFGGSVSTICHGAGMGTPTISDLVEEVQYIDSNGDDQVVNDPEELRCAAGAFGFLGVITSVVLRVEPATVAEIRPTQVPLVLAIPPPEGFPLPEIVAKQVKEAGITQADMDAARKEFVRRAEEDHFHEFFWYPYQKNAWLNTWKRRPLTDADKDLPTYPQFGIAEGDFASQGAAAALADNIAKIDSLPGRLQTYAFGLASLAGLPNIRPGTKPMTTRTSEAVHFRGGSQTFPFYGMEWELPVPPSETGEKRDYTMIQRAWWDAITLIYASPNAPLRAALEMRLTNGSSVLLAPQRGNQTSDLGTASLEVFTLLTAPAEEWQEFRQKIIDHWTAYAYELEGIEGRKARPHWNKQFADLRVRGKPMKEYLREDAYTEAFAKFREALESIHSRRGTSVMEARERFSSRLMESYIWDD
ncbi:FAD-binding domain-containing protein [Auriculariales sp. MPI-PUGE-AT-0066]|nr:FAD-binding domain-containing protein [Auriculariales sp. MPI-PUGE-AT-0066]